LGGANLKDLIIREERESDYFNVEYMTKKAFWNLHAPGCNEHYLVHILRKSDDYIPELSRVAELNGEIVGAIMYSKAYVTDEVDKTEVLNFGPLCVDPKYQNKGISKTLLEITMNIAKEAGYKGIVIFGEPDYYPRHGFKTCDNFRITTSDNKNFPAFMGIELAQDGFKDVRGKFYESEVFENLLPEKVEEFDKKFPYMEKLKLPGQWDY
jgi:putative acetyltransferase